MEAKKDMVPGHDLRHDRHTVSLLTFHLVFSPKYSVSWIAKRLKGRSSKQTILEKAFTEKRSQSVGQGWEVAERYISGQKNYLKKEDAVPVVVVDEEKEKTHKIGHITLYTKFFAVTGPVP